MNEVYNSNGYKITWEQGTGIPGNVIAKGKEIKSGAYYFKFVLWKGEEALKNYSVNLKYPDVTPDVIDGVINVFKRFMI